jgi:hypothetical protein
MKIKEIRTRLLRWRGKTIPLPSNFCTNPMDLLELSVFDADLYLSRVAGGRDYYR